MNFAALFITHKNMQQAAHLLRFFCHEKVECFVHIDQKYRCDFENTKKLLESQSNVHVLDTRLSGTLADWSLVRITMLLVKTAKKYGLKRGINFNYYGLFSGQDYPIKPWNQFWNALKKDYPKNYIDVWKHGDMNLMNKFQKYRFWKLQNFLYTVIRNDSLRKCLKVPVYCFEKMISALWKTPEKKLRAMEIGLYEGSAWWILTDQMIDFILKEWKDGNYYLKIIANTSTPEESVFQILVMRSPYRESVEKGDHKHIYCNFTPKGKPATGHPYDITIDDLKSGEILQTSFFFARKFDFKNHPDVMEWIDHMILE